MKRVVCLLLLFLCASCKNITSVQTGYVSDRDECRSHAEDKMQAYSQPEAYSLGEKEKNNALLFLFCECMKSRDWNVVGCKDAKAPTAIVSAPRATPAPYTPPPGYALVPMSPVPNVSPSAGGLEPSAKDRVLFDYNRTVLRPDGQEILQQQAVWLKQHPNVNVIIEGHCDERGTREYNIALGDRRANAVKDYLSNLGVSPNRMQTVSYGKERPDAIGADESAWSQNRRSVTVIPVPQ